MIKRYKYTDEIIEYIKSNYKGKDNIELAEELNKKFNLNTNGDKISMLKANLKRRYGLDLRTGINRGCIKKGNIPANKGKKWDEYLTKEQQERARKTCFKKGHKSANAVDIGTEHIRWSTTDDKGIGYLNIKVCDGKGNKNWIPKQRYIYEQHYGKIPKGHKVIFADGNRFNFDIDNLILVSENENLILNQKSLRANDKEITNTGVLIAKVISKTYEKQNERL